MFSVSTLTAALNRKVDGLIVISYTLKVFCFRGSSQKKLGQLVVTHSQKKKKNHPSEEKRSSYFLSIYKYLALIGPNVSYPVFGQQQQKKKSGHEP